MKMSWVDAAYRRQEVAEWCKAQGEWDLEVVERAFGWLSRNRQMSKEYERKVQTSETLIAVAMIRLLTARQGRRL
jgi:putative transposase